jgi:hypothetical protein
MQGKAAFQYVIACWGKRKWIKQDHEYFVGTVWKSNCQVLDILGCLCMYILFYVLSSRPCMYCSMCMYVYVHVYLYKIDRFLILGTSIRHRRRFRQPQEVVRQKGML